MATILILLLSLLLNIDGKIEQTTSSPSVDRDYFKIKIFLTRANTLWNRTGTYAFSSLGDRIYIINGTTISGDYKTQ